MKENPWTVSNGLSLLRIVLVVPITFLLYHEGENRFLIVSLIVLAVLTDYLDGALARRAGRTTELGKIIDPVADKIALAAVALVLTLEGRLPVWFLFMAGGRDLIILMVGLYIKLRRGIVLQSNFTGKWTSGIIALYVTLVILRLDGFSPVEHTALALSVMMIILSFVLYGYRTIRFLSAVSDPQSPEKGV